MWSAQHRAQAAVIHSVAFLTYLCRFIVTNLDLRFTVLTSHPEWVADGTAVKPVSTFHSPTCLYSCVNKNLWGLLWADFRCRHSSDSANHEG